MSRISFQCLKDYYCFFWEIDCPEDLFVCPDGSYVSRNPYDNCEFYPCGNDVFFCSISLKMSRILLFSCKNVRVYISKFSNYAVNCTFFNLGGWMNFNIAEKFICIVLESYKYAQMEAMFLVILMTIVNFIPVVTMFFFFILFRKAMWKLDVLHQLPQSKNSCVQWTKS